MRQFLIMTAFSAIISCSQKAKTPTSTPPFVIKELQIDVDTVIASASYYQKLFVLQQANGKFIVLDTSFKRQDSLQRRLNRFNFEYMYEHRDSIFFGKKKKDYFLDSNFELKAFKRKFRRYGTGLYEDSLFYIYGCCAGEFGGSVFFLNKVTSSTYSYFSTCPRQVLKFNNEYFVSINLAHLSSSTSFLFIKNPTTLYHLKEEKQKNFCNWYVDVDSIKDSWHIKNTENIRYFRGPRSTMTLVNYVYRDSLYSILTNDTITYITVHRNDSLDTRQIIYNKGISFHYNTVKKAGLGIMCFYELTGGSPVEAFYKTGNNSGLIYIKENTIYILSFKKRSK